jgi:uncharacterized protein involved in exopolysaccharide biosynthesis
MAMDAVLKQLESRIEELVKAYDESKKAETALTKKVEKLESQLASDTETSGRLAELEKQRDDLGRRLEKVLSLIDATLEEAD